MTDEQVIMELRRRSRHRGHQIVGYRRKLMQQVKKKRILTVYSFYHLPNYSLSYGNLIILRNCDYLFYADCRDEQGQIGSQKTA